MGKVIWTATNQLRWIKYSRYTKEDLIVLEQKHISALNAVRWIEVPKTWTKIESKRLN